MIELRSARLSDIKIMQELVASEVSGGVILARSDDEIATNIRSYVIAQNKDEIAGYAALHIHSVKLAEVRSLVVRSNLRGQKIGSLIVDRLIKDAANMGIKSLFTLTYRASFFERAGFRVISKTELPEQKIWADCIKCKHFPVCDEVALIYSFE